MIYVLNRKQTVSQFNVTFRHITDLLTICNQGFENYLNRMNPGKLEIKGTTDSNSIIVHNLDLLLSTGRNGERHSSLSDKCGDFNVLITHVRH